MKLQLLLGLSVAAMLAAPLAASAQDHDRRYDDRDNDRRIVGRIVESRPYNLQLDRGPHIFLHNGTVIRPRGLSLRDGMPVAVIGHRIEGGFAADEIDVIRRHDRDDRDDRDRDRR